MSKVPSNDKASDWIVDISGDAETIEFATSTRARLRGMLFRDPDEVTRLLVPCHDIHTFGMHHPLDIAFISKDGRVLDVYRDVYGRQRIRRKGAAIVAERFSREGEWLKTGDVIKLGASGVRRQQIDE